MVTVLLPDLWLPIGLAKATHKGGGGGGRARQDVSSQQGSVRLHLCVLCIVSVQCTVGCSIPNIWTEFG